MPVDRTDSSLNCQGEVCDNHLQLPLEEEYTIDKRLTTELHYLEESVHFALPVDGVERACALLVVDIMLL